MKPREDITCPITTLDEASESADDVDRQVAQLRQSVRAKLQAQVNFLLTAGFAALPFKQKQRYADRIAGQLVDLKYRIKCPKSGCGEPGLPAVELAGNATKGIIRISHGQGSPHGIAKLEPKPKRFRLICPKRDRRKTRRPSPIASSRPKS